MDLSYKHRGLFTDFYQLTMAQSYFETGKIHKNAVFELFFRKSPFNGSYVVLAGVNDAMQYLNSFAFFNDDIAYLESLKRFSDDFLNYLSKMKFQGHVSGVLEGSIVFPHEPLLQISGKLGELQLVETALLNIINYQSLIATKSSRIVRAAYPGAVIEFGLRRAQGDGGIIGSRAAMIGGCIGTSNVLAGKLFDIPVSGTHAHSWVQSFQNEIDAFRAYINVFPVSSILLVDTYDVLNQGVPNAIIIGQEMKDRGENLFGIRIDSGDLAWLSIKSAELLDFAGLLEVKILLSNELDEYVIQSIINQIRSNEEYEPEFRERVINRLIYGVGTNLITGGNQAALGGVFKITEFLHKPVIKVSENAEKTTNPGRKKLWRLKTKDGKMISDVISLYEEPIPKVNDVLFHPVDQSKSFKLKGLFVAENLHTTLFKDNQILIKEVWQQAQRRYIDQLRTLDFSHLRFLNPHPYKVSLSERLIKLKKQLFDKKITD